MSNRRPASPPWSRSMSNRRPYNIDLSLIAPCPEGLEDTDTQPCRYPEMSWAAWFAAGSASLVGFALCLLLMGV